MENKKQVPFEIKKVKIMEEDKIKYKKFLQGDNQSLEELMKKYQTNLLFFITRYVKNKEIAEDIYQDVIIYF